MSSVPVVIVGAGPYGLSLGAHLGALGIEHRIFGRPMRSWAQVAEAADKRYLKSFCFATNLSSPKDGFTFADFNTPRGLETFEPCSMGNFTQYGQWFQQHNVSWSEPADVAQIEREGEAFRVILTSGERILAGHVVIATGLAHYAHTPKALAGLPAELAIHTSRISSFTKFKGSKVAIVGAGQSALEAAALLHEAGAFPQLLVREERVLWHSRTFEDRNLWQQIRRPISGLGVGPKNWLLFKFPGALNQLPEGLRNRMAKGHLPPEGAWWLRERVENRLPIHTGTSVLNASDSGSQVALQCRVSGDGSERQITVDHVVVGSGYDINVDRLQFLDGKIRSAVDRIGRYPRLNARFECSVPGLHFVGPTSAMSFGPLFRFVVGADYTAKTLSTHLGARVGARKQSAILSAA